MVIEYNALAENNTSQAVNRIILGDTIDSLKKLETASVDVIFADPPYYMQTEGELLRNDGSKFAGVEDEWDKFNGYDEYDRFSYEWIRECKRVLKDDGTMWVIGAFQNIYRIGYIMQNLGFWILNDVVWSKPNAVPNFGGTRFQNSHETLLWCSKSKDSKFTFNYKTMKHLNNKKQDKSVWNVSICIGGERIKGEDGKKVHSTQKPERLLEKVVLSSTKPDDIILDPFFGTGTTGAVAKRFGRRFIGIEREALYVNIAEMRIHNTEDISDDISNLVLETKPPKVPMQNLLNMGYLTVNQELYNKDGKTICRVLQNGKVSDGKQELSIHKMSAKELNRTNNNGWEYFYVNYNHNFIPLNELRYIFSEENENG